MAGLQTLNLTGETYKTEIRSRVAGLLAQVQVATMSHEPPSIGPKS